MEKSSLSLLMEIICFFLGVVYFYTRSYYAISSALLLFVLTPRYWLILAYLLGLGLAWIHQSLIAPQGLPLTGVMPKASLEGTISVPPVVSDYKTQFTFMVEKLNNLPARGLIQLSWYEQAPLFHVGQKWALQASLKQPRNFQNPGYFDYVNALGARHIFWTGIIHPHNSYLLVKNSHRFRWEQLRERLSQRITQLAPNEQIAGIIEALTLNMTTHINQDEWSLFRRTGTTHLFGISGEHIALLSGMFFWLVWLFWSQSQRACLAIPAQSIAGISAFLGAFFYALLAGFAPPVQRALIGCFFYTLRHLGKQHFSAWQMWRYALCGVLCIEPHAVLMQGFYFSFLAVAFILLTHQRWSLKGYPGTLGLQLCCLIGLMPLSLYWFSYGSINGYVANIIAIPLVGFIIVPLSLLTLLFSTFQVAGLLMKVLAGFITLLLQILQWIEHLSWLNVSVNCDSLALILASLGGLILFLVLPVKPFNYLVPLWLVLPFFPWHPTLKYGETLIQVLDVGQGLAVAITTKTHHLLYDTGDQFFHGNDLGAMVIVPFYRSTGVKYIDKIVISHPDKDHRGGLKSVETSLPVGELIVDNPSYYHRGLNCHQYPAWNWDGVGFRFFPLHSSTKDKNNNSCVLQVSSKTSRVLLTGDIEASAEDYLVQTYGAQLKSEVLIVPHHGSKTSSSYRFLTEVSPQYALASLGFANRFHFPHVKTLTNMKTLGISFLRTDECGMISVDLSETLGIPQCYSRIR